MTYFKKVGQFVIPAALILLPVLAFAQGLPNPTPPITGGGSAITLIQVEQLIQRIAGFLIVVGVIIAVIFIVYGGIRYMASGDDTSKAKAIIFNGIIGAAVVLGVGVILQTVAGLVARTFFN